MAYGSTFSSLLEDKSTAVEHVPVRAGKMRYKRPGTIHRVDHVQVGGLVMSSI